ncbi:Meiotic expression up-regulated protein 26 [Nosema granulosis]|uniref:Meiotic expression up-regulated protein 26 n=1 Tax=Nosema granulosis TaxID=83296 RepID=A0A9P6GY49_9MICR|nr:Meiotic expression up-regulated protein 26 [Nosema granulosis]
MKKNVLYAEELFSVDKYLSPFVLNSEELYDVDTFYQNNLYEVDMKGYIERNPPPSSDSIPKKHKKREKDIYKPQQTRGYGQEREGFCNECKKWFRLKTSSYWYHMNYKHGINSNGVRYPEPEVRVKSCKVEAYCQACNEWIVLGNKSNQKSIKFGWYKHWQKNHSTNMTI